MELIETNKNTNNNDNGTETDKLFLTSVTKASTKLMEKKKKLILEEEESKIKE